jgi:DNA-damage-inducible protein J
MAQVSVRVDDEVKRNAEATLNAIGIPMSTAVNVFLKAVAREHRIPFELNADPFYSDSNMRHIKRGIEALDAGKGVEHELLEDG